PRTPAPSPACPVLRPGTPTRARSAPPPLADHARACRDAPGNTRRRRGSGTAATGRHGDGHGPADSPALAHRDSHTRGGANRASRGRGYGGGGALGAWERAVAEALARALQPLAHTRHRRACACGPRTVWARWNACAWAELVQVGWADLAWIQ